jgi:thioredoxin-like negative regulator of GroEL
LGYAHLNAQINSNRKARAGREATVTLAWILFRIGHADVAERVLKGVLNAGAIGSESAYYAALILADRGQREAAQKILASALRSKAQFPGRDEAQRILKQLAQVEQASAPVKKQK